MGAGSPWRMDGAPPQTGELRQVAADELAAGVEPLALRDRIEDTEVRLRVRARRRGPLPAAVVGSQVEIVQLQREIAFTVAPIDAEILRKEARHDHPQPVVHVARLVQLAHRGIDERITRASLAPSSEVSRRLLAALPLHGVILAPE